MEEGNKSALIKVETDKLMDKNIKLRLKICIMSGLEINISIKVETDKLMDKNFKKEFPGLGFHQVAMLYGHILSFLPSLNAGFKDTFVMCVFKKNQAFLDALYIIISIHSKNEFCGG